MFVLLFAQCSYCTPLACPAHATCPRGDMTPNPCEPPWFTISHRHCRVSNLFVAVIAGAIAGACRHRRCHSRCVPSLLVLQQVRSVARDFHNLHLNNCVLLPSCCDCRLIIFSLGHIVSGRRHRRVSTSSSRVTVHASQRRRQPSSAHGDVRHHRTVDVGS